MNDRNDDSPDLSCLLIGVDCYLPNELPGGSYYANLGVRVRPCLRR